MNASTRNAVTRSLPRSWLIAPLVMLFALPAMELTGIDRQVSGWFYDAAAHAFPLRSTFLFETVLHYWTKYAVILATFVAAAALGFTYVISELRRRRRTLLFILLAMTLAPLTVTALKQITDRPCPWDLAEFGGTAPYIHLFQSRGEHHPRGKCFPAGHAATGFALLAFFFAAHHEKRRSQARAALVAGLSGGLLLGIARVAQGAHFISHVLWSGLVCWLVMLTLYVLLMRPDRPPAVRPHPVPDR